MEDSESAESKLAVLLEPQGWQDWHSALDFEDRRLELLEFIEISYSQFSAYMILLDRFDWDLEELAEALRFALGKVQTRIVASYEHMGFQPSLFDKIQVIDRNFQPTRGYGVISMPVQEEGPLQFAWDFPEVEKADRRVQKGNGAEPT